LEKNIESLRALRERGLEPGAGCGTDDWREGDREVSLVPKGPCTAERLGGYWLHRRSKFRTGRSKNIHRGLEAASQTRGTHVLRGKAVKWAECSLSLSVSCVEFRSR